MEILREINIFICETNDKSFNFMKLLLDKLNPIEWNITFSSSLEVINNCKHLFCGMSYNPRIRLATRMFCQCMMGHLLESQRCYAEGCLDAQQTTQASHWHLMCGTGIVVRTRADGTSYWGISFGPAAYGGAREANVHCLPRGRPDWVNLINVRDKICIFFHFVSCQ